MRRIVLAILAAAAASPYLVASLPAHAVNACTADNPNTTSAIETTPTADFTVNGNGTVTHKKTGLMWKVCQEGKSGAACATGTETLMGWSDALKRANIANSAAFAGYTDWRLPTVKELESILERCGFNSAINKVIFPAQFGGRYWSGTTYQVNSAQAFWISYDVGQIETADKGLVLNSVRLVRGGHSYDALPAALPCSLDVDGNSAIDALTDGLMLLRAMFGLTGTSVTNNAIGGNPTRSTWGQIQPYLNTNCGTTFAP
jgi:uncharacterized protein DUF1566